MSEAASGAKNHRVSITIPLRAIAWGIIISDFTRHVARALSQRYGKNEEQEMAKIRDCYLGELKGPTSPISGQ